ncbi:cation channel protein, putative [Bodo saltans]|uniref:Cation channel protein, putative n=1 Tax=Bodo saltans TaxID=75058 RepID=A0A0S4JKP5_BODSA|nr:cation channel protein, putative [Bodo saltans]|eukprot:CUG90502.1 cation channel protein, putative [Bodo saltans]
MQRLKSKKFQSFKAGAKSTNVAAPPPLLNVDDVQRTATLPGNLVDGQNSAVLVAEEGELVESDHDSDELAAMGTVELPHNSKIREDVAMNVIIKNRLAAAGVNACNEVSVKDLILRLSVASSPSPTITEDEAARIVSLLSETYRSNEEITRNAFMLLLKQHADEPELQNVEMEELVLYLFPDDVNAVGCLRQLIHRCQVSSNHHGFSVKYAEQRLQDWGDAKELFFYVPFLALYLCLVVSGKFIAPRSYYGYGASVAVSNTLYAPTFTSCSYDAQSVSQCNDTKSVTATTLAGRTDWYYYMQQVFVPALWVASSPSSTAAETILGNDLRLVGAVKIRNIRVIGSEDLSDAEKYFGPKNATYSKTYPGYSRSNTDKSEHPNYFLNNTVFPTNSVLPGFDGLHYKTCSELNASGSVLGNLDSFSCDGHGLVIPLNTTNSQVLAIIATLASTEWIDRQTRAVVAEILLFHPESTMLIRSQLLVEFQPGGGLTTTTTIHPFTFATFSSVDFVFNALYILFFVLLFLNIIRYVVWNFLRPLFIGGPSRDFLRFRNHMVLDFLNYAMFVVSAISRLIWMNIGSPTDPVWLTTYYPNGFEDAATYYNTFVIIDGFNVMLCVLGLLRFGKFIPAMGIVVKALVNSSKDAGALLFVIIGTFLSLVVCAASVFGDSVLGYHSVLWAAETLGQAFIGNYDYTPLHDAHPTFAFVFFFVFQLTITVILLNMFIAVFTDAFNAAMESSFDRVTSTHILDNTAQHPFVRSNAWSLALGSMPVQSVKATFFRARQFFSCDCTRNNALDVDFFSYDSTLARSMRLLISTANIGAIAKKRDGKVDKLIAGGGGRRDSSLFNSSLHMSSTLHSINTVAASETMNFSDLLIVTPVCRYSPSRRHSLELDSSFLATAQRTMLLMWISSRTTLPSLDQ